jgi:hypothetical protein
VAFRETSLHHIRVIVIDEIFTCNIFKLTLLREFIIKHARMADGAPRKFCAAGDPYQNLPIESNPLLFKRSKEKRAYIMDAVATLFPFQLTLRICKRLTDPREQQLLEQIHTRLFVRDEEPSEVVCDIATPIFDVKDVQGLAICYKRATANAVNARMHALSLVGRTDVIEVGDQTYYPGLVLVCREYVSKGVFTTDASGEFKIRTCLHTNINLIFLHNTPKGIVLEDALGKRRVLVTHALAASHLTHNHARTCHAEQGSSATAVTIFDHNYLYAKADPGWAYTAISRAIDLKQIFVYRGPNLEDAPLGEAVNAAIRKKIHAHKYTDRRAGRTWLEDEYVTPADVLQLHKDQNHNCALCGLDIELHWSKGDQNQLSIDRIDNSLAHVRANCQLTCLRCNKAKH